MHWVVEYEMSSSLGASLYLNAWATTFDGRRVPFGWFMSLSETNAEWCCLERSSKSTTSRGVWRVRWLWVTSTIWTISTAPSGKDLLQITTRKKAKKKKHSKIRWWFPTPKKICVKLDHPFASTGDFKKKKWTKHNEEPPMLQLTALKSHEFSSGSGHALRLWPRKNSQPIIGVESEVCGVILLWGRSSLT